MWTPPHFWALALYRDSDYAKAGVPMLPVVAGREATKRQILLYTALLVPLTLVPVWQGVAGSVYAMVMLVLGGCFLLLAWRVLRGKGDKAPRLLFGFSILYLFLLFGVLILDRAPGLLEFEVGSALIETTSAKL
jgi:protoheme IX farnesyltransferase